MTRVLLLVKGLGRGGAEQIVVNTVASGDRSRFDYEVGYVLPWKDALVPSLRNLRVPTHSLGAADSHRWPASLRRLIRERGIDVVHAHSPVPAVAARLLRGRRQRIVYTEHNVWQRYSRPTRWANAMTLVANDHVFAVSDEVRRSIQPPALRWKAMPPVETLYHGVDRAAFERRENVAYVRAELGLPQEAPLVVTVANLKAHKGHRYLLEAVGRLRPSMPEVRFLCVGIGPLADDLRRDAERLGLSGSVVFTGFRDDVPRIVAAADLFVLPSEHEGLPLALLEAMTAGKPCVATAVGGVPEVVRDGHDGLLVPPRDSAALAEAMSMLLTDEPLRSRVGASAREGTARFDAKRAVTRMEEVYEELARR
jgi:glycosyltransferase involved in cell wall biosynthesis